MCLSITAYVETCPGGSSYYHKTKLTIDRSPSLLPHNQAGSWYCQCSHYTSYDEPIKNIHATLFLTLYCLSMQRVRQTQYLCVFTVQVRQFKAVSIASTISKAQLIIQIIYVYVVCVMCDRTMIWLGLLDHWWLWDALMCCCLKYSLI